mmetsp:Transcript_1255/g.2861  ORF Transcript_1255/g.2861 Transcript_1255/m.2861 type:complete len:307 (-) Transcript_1255:399-1319(-)
MCGHSHCISLSMSGISAERRLTIVAFSGAMNIQTFEELELAYQILGEKPFAAALEDEARANIIGEAWQHHTHSQQQQQQQQEQQQEGQKEGATPKEEHNVKGFSRMLPPTYIVTNIQKPDGMDGFDASSGCFIRFAEGFTRPLQGMNIQHGEALLSWNTRHGVWAFPKSMSQEFNQKHPENKAKIEEAQPEKTQTPQKPKAPRKSRAKGGKGTLTLRLKPSHTGSAAAPTSMPASAASASTTPPSVSTATPAPASTSASASMSTSAPPGQKLGTVFADYAEDDELQSLSEDEDEDPSSDYVDSKQG